MYFSDFSAQRGRLLLHLFKQAGFKCLFEINFSNNDPNELINSACHNGMLVCG